MANSQSQALYTEEVRTRCRINSVGAVLLSVICKHFPSFKVTTHLPTLEALKTVVSAPAPYHHFFYFCCKIQRQRYRHAHPQVLTKGSLSQVKPVHTYCANFSVARIIGSERWDCFQASALQYFCRIKNIREKVKKRIYPREYLQWDSCPSGLQTQHCTNSDVGQSVHGAFLLSLGKGQNSNHCSEIWGFLWMKYISSVKQTYMWLKRLSITPKIMCTIPTTTDIFIL